MQPRFKAPQKTEIIVDEKGFQLNRLFRFFDELSKGSWKKSYPPTADTGAVNYIVTSNPALVSLILASITPYQRDDQTWLADLNICLTVASAARTTITMSIANLTFKNTTGLFQPVTGYAMDGSNAYLHNCYAILNTGNIIINHASATTVIYGFRATGLILDEKPSFAE
jgi:hypothetical protein